MTKQSTEKKMVTVCEDDLKKYINNKELSDIENTELSGLIFDFIEENDLGNKFYKFLERKNEEYDYCYDIKFLMLDYK
jgi:hypothetical protein